MKILIVYSTYGGVTQKCANMLSEILKEKHDVYLVNAREEEIPPPINYDVAVIGSSVRIGSINKKIKKYVKSNMDVLISMPCAVFYCCGYTKQFQEYADTQMPAKFLPSLGYHLFGGELKPDKLSGMDKIIVKIMRDAILSQDFEEDDKDHHELPEIIPENILLLAKEIEKFRSK